jgi:hypothetical protein
MSSRPPELQADHVPVTTEASPEAVGPIVDRLWPGVDVRLADGVEPDLDTCEADLDRLIANRIISAVRIQCYTGDVLIYERAFVFARQPLAPGGSEVDPSLESLPDEARFRVVVTPNPDVPEASRETWFDHLGWSAAAPLRKPPAVVPQTYLTSVHDEYASDETPPLCVQHQLWVNPQFAAAMGSTGDNPGQAERAGTPGNVALEKASEN